MRRLYPQVLKAENAIQQLRTELNSVELEGKDQRGELNEADNEIQDLRSLLGEAERQQAYFMHELSELGMESERLKLEYEQAEQDEHKLGRELHSCWQGNVTDRQMLQKAAKERNLQQETIEEAEMFSASGSENIQREDKELKELRAEHEELAFQNDCLENELDGAQFHSKKQRKFLATEEQESAWQYHCNCVASVSNKQGHGRVESLELCRQALAKRLRELEDARREGDDLDRHLEHAKRTADTLGSRLDGINHVIRARNQELDHHSGWHTELRSKLQESEAEASQMRATRLKQHLDEEAAKQAHHDMQESEHAEAEQTLASMEESFDCEARNLDSETEASHMVRESHQEKVNQLQESSKSLAGRLAGLEEEVRKLYGRISVLDTDCTSLGTQNNELEQLIVEVKKKPNCLIS